MAMEIWTETGQLNFLVRLETVKSQVNIVIKECLNSSEILA